MKKLLNEWRLYIAKESKLAEKSIKHNCATHVKENSTGEVGDVISHSLTEDGSVEFYDVQFEGRLEENVSIDDLEVIEMHEHVHPVGKRDKKLKKHKELKQTIKEEIQRMHKQLLKEAIDRYKDPATGKIFKLIPRKKGGMKIGCSVNSCNMRPLNPAEWAAEMEKTPPALGSCKGSGCYKNIGPETE